MSKHMVMLSALVAAFASFASPFTEGGVTYTPNDEVARRQPVVTGVNVTGMVESVAYTKGEVDRRIETNAPVRSVNGMRGNVRLGAREVGALPDNRAYLEDDANFVNAVRNVQIKSGGGGGDIQGNALVFTNGTVVTKDGGKTIGYFSDDEMDIPYDYGRLGTGPDGDCIRWYRDAGGTIRLYINDMETVTEAMTSLDDIPYFYVTGSIYPTGGGTIGFYNQKLMKEVRNDNSYWVLRTNGWEVGVLEMKPYPTERVKKYMVGVYPVGSTSGETKWIYPSSFSQRVELSRQSLFSAELTIWPHNLKTTPPVGLDIFTEFAEGIKQDIGSVDYKLTSHKDETDNPHGVTAEQVGAVPFVADTASGGKTAITIGERWAGPIGISSFAHGDFVTASGYCSFASGMKAYADGRHSHAEGLMVRAGDGAVGHDFAYVWQGSGAETFYNSHGEGTFNLNPKPAVGSSDPLTGFWVGEKTMAQRINDGITENALVKYQPVAASVITVTNTTTSLNPEIRISRKNANGTTENFRLVQTQGNAIINHSSGGGDYDVVLPKASGTLALAKAASLNVMLEDAETNQVAMASTGTKVMSIIDQPVSQKINASVSANLNTYVDGETGVEYVGKFYEGSFYYVPTGNVYPPNN